LFFKLIEVETKFPFANSISAFSRNQGQKRKWRHFQNISAVHPTTDIVEASGTLLCANSGSRVRFARRPCRSQACLAEGAGGEASSWSMATSSV
jgi:hypothetical protein